MFYILEFQGLISEMKNSKYFPRKAYQSKVTQFCYTTKENLIYFLKCSRIFKKSGKWGKSYLLYVIQ